MERVTKERLTADVNAVLLDAEELLRQAGQMTGEEARELRARGLAMLERAKASLHDVEQRAVEQTRAAARATDTWVHQHPWTAIGLAAGVAFLVGLAVNRR